MARVPDARPRSDLVPNSDSTQSEERWCFQLTETAPPNRNSSRTIRAAANGACLTICSLLGLAPRRPVRFHPFRYGGSGSRGHPLPPARRRRSGSAGHGRTDGGTERKVFEGLTNLYHLGGNFPEPRRHLINGRLWARRARRPIEKIYTVRLVGPMPTWITRVTRRGYFTGTRCFNSSSQLSTTRMTGAVVAPKSP